MTVELSSMFSQVIQDHLELKERNAQLEGSMPLVNYKNDDPFNNHPLFKTEEQARLEETLEGEDAVVAHASTVVAWPGEETAEQTAPNSDDSLWTKSRDFDWGD